MFENSYTIIIIIGWLLLLILGIRYLIKNKLWKQSNYFLIFVLVFGYIIILFQVIIILIEFFSKIENYENKNTHFKLFDRNNLQLIPNQRKYSWEEPLSYGKNLSTTNYNNSYVPRDHLGNVMNHLENKNCSNDDISQLSELVTASKQQLQDAQIAYQNLLNLKYQFTDGNIRDFDDLHKIIKNANKKIGFAHASS
jgi:hypothetical protein